MHAAPVERLTEYLHTRVTEDEHTAAAAAASESGLSMSQWVRGAIQKALNVAPLDRILLEEVLALRLIVLKIAPGHLDPEGLAKRADGLKVKMAVARIESYGERT